MKVTVSVSAGTDDPTRSTLGLVAAKAALEQGHEVLIWLQGEAAVLANRKVPIWVCEACGKGRGVTPEVMLPTAAFHSMGELVAAAETRDRLFSF